MKKTMIWLIVLFLWSFAACNSIEDMDPTLLNGHFTGTFERTTGGDSQGIVEVALTFEGNSFSGEGGANRYPTICQGTFAVEGDSINFSNGCFFTADFDWTLILNGDFQVSLQGAEIVLRRQRDHILDTYTLKKN